MMRGKILLMTLWAVLLFLGGCSKNVGEPDDGRGTPLALKAGTLESVSRAGGILDGETFLPEGERVGVFVVDYASAMSWTGASFVAENLEGTLGAQAGTVQPITFDSAIYYKPGQLHDIFAYYPYFPESASGNGISYGADGIPVLTVALTSAAQYDVITAEPQIGITAITADADNQKLQFFHRLSLMRFSMVKDEAITDAITLTKIVFTMDQSQTVVVNVTDGTVESEAGGAVSYEYSDNYAIPSTADADALFKFLFCPDSTITGITLTIDDAIDYATPGDWAGIPVPLAGNANNVIITIHPAEITFTVGDGGWVDEDDPIYVTNPTLKTGFTVVGNTWEDGVEVSPITPNILNN